MKKFLLATTAFLSIAASPALADVVVDNKLSGTGDNVIFNSLVGSTALGTFNGQHQGVVRFIDLSGNPNFVAAQSGNDIKIQNTTNLSVQVFDSANVNVQATATDVFSLKGTGDVQLFVDASLNGVAEPVKFFDLGQIDPNAQSGFTLTAINGEVITKFRLLDVGGGNITDFEHYRIDVASPIVTPVPEASTWAMMLLGFLGVGLFGMRKRNSFRLA